MLSEDELRAMSEPELDELRRRLAGAAATVSLVKGRAQRERFIAMTAVAAIVLLGWVLYLAATLPRTYTTGHWRLTWVGFDCALAATLAVTAVLALWRRQLVIITSLVAGSLLVCDAWFDVTTAAGADRWLSWLSVPIEISLAGALITTAGVFVHHLTATASTAPVSGASYLAELPGVRTGGVHATINALLGRPD